MKVKPVSLEQLPNYYDSYPIIIKYDTEYAVVKKVNNQLIDIQTGIPITLNRLINLKLDILCYVVLEGEIPNNIQCSDCIEHLYHNCNIAIFTTKSNDQLKKILHV